jgi:hypothetical protein
MFKNLKIFVDKLLVQLYIYKRILLLRNEAMFL